MTERIRESDTETDRQTDTQKEREMGRERERKRAFFAKYQIELKDSVACLVGFLTSSSATSVYHGRVPRLTSDNFSCCHTRDRAGRP